MLSHKIKTLPVGTSLDGGGKGEDSCGSKGNTHQSASNILTSLTVGINLRVGGWREGRRLLWEQGEQSPVCQQHLDIFDCGEKSGWVEGRERTPVGARGTLTRVCQQHLDIFHYDVELIIQTRFDLRHRCILPTHNRRNVNVNLFIFSSSVICPHQRASDNAKGFSVFVFVLSPLIWCMYIAFCCWCWTFYCICTFHSFIMTYIFWFQIVVFWANSVR